MSIYPTLRQIEAFLKVAQLGSFGRAADALGLSQSALSQAITQMEFLLGVRLFDRTTRTVRLSAVGEQFRPRAERLLAEFDLALHDLKETSELRRGRVTIACLSSIAFRFLPVVISGFKTHFPQISIIVRDDNAQGVLQRLKSGEADLAICSLVEEEPEIRFTPLLEDRFQLVCRRDHPLAAKKRIRWRDLAGHDFIAMASDTGIRALLDRELPAPAVLPKALYEVSHLATVIGLIQEGVAVSVLPALAAPREARLCLRPIEDPPVYRVLGLIAARDRSLTPAAEAFRDVLLSMLGSGRTPRLQDVRILRQDAAGRGGATPSSSAPAGIRSAARRGR